LQLYLPEKISEQINKLIDELAQNVRKSLIEKIKKKFEMELNLINYIEAAFTPTAEENEEYSQLQKEQGKVMQNKIGNYVQDIIIKAQEMKKYRKQEMAMDMQLKSKWDKEKVKKKIVNRVSYRI
jgi:hypothetical protein